MTGFHAGAQLLRLNVAQVVTALLLVPLSGGPLRAAETWADPNLTVRDGLELWLDAAHTAGPDDVPENTKLKGWADGSGKNRSVRQADTEARPTLLKFGAIGIVRFDGANDHLRAENLGASLDSFTVVVVAAPRQNLGNFAALMALNAPNERDYMSGLNIDQGPAPGVQFSSLNVEGRGFGGARNLLTQPSPFARLHKLVVMSDSAEKTVRLIFDGDVQGDRPREGGDISMDEVTIGARYYNNGAGPQRADGFGRNDICEVLVYNRALKPDELASLDNYLTAKYDFLKDILPPDQDLLSAALETVKDPPPVQMFVPGFRARELPLDLTNINNVMYRPDGTLVALAYDGKIWLLRDTNSDGLEDKADLFWDNSTNLRSPIGMDLTPPGYARGDGVFVVGHSRFVVIVDTDRDDKADKEIEIVGGWNEILQSVDGLGVAYDSRDGSLYYGRGTRNFTEPLLKDKDGKAQYRLDEESGTINRVSADFKTHEIVATGVRFPVALRFNARGDLFCTDQEGATWVPNGNPFDELLHIQKGRHYGFPARHPVHLPNVIDEPSTYDYTPQHQSTCGLNFNEPVKPGGPVFGPNAWKGDALVIGESRGKLYRTQLVLAPAGYVARTSLLGSLTMLSIDACVSPAGDLVVCCHSGAPDWGTGPSGKGKLYKIAYSDPEHPQPVAVWPIGPREIRVEFDRPVPAKMLHDVLTKASLTGGAAARAGDRFETIWPGYAIVQAQKLSQRIPIRLHSAQLTQDGRTLVLATDPVAQAVHYALTLPDERAPNADAAAVLPQHPAIDLDFDLSGCEAIWQPASAAATWTGWLPHIDLQISQAFTLGSAPHEQLAKSLDDAGELTLRGQLDLVDMLRPAVQPGSKIDHPYPPETVTVTFKTSTKATLQLAGDAAKWSTTNNASTVSFTVPGDAPKLVPFELRLKKDSGPATLNVEWATNEDSRPRPLAVRRLLLPWAERGEKPFEAALAKLPPELEGGSWARGYQEFFGEKAMCSKCHTIYGKGGNIGPDLSNLVHRDYASVMRDITHPSFAINPDYLTYTVVLTSGRLVDGVLRSAGDVISIGDNQGVKTEVARDDVEELRPASVSTMPENLLAQLGPDRTRDLLAFMLTSPPSMPHDHPGPRPKPRTEAEVNAVLAGAPSPPEQTRKLNILLVAGPKDHGVGEHDYPAWQKAWPSLLTAAGNVETDTAWEWPTPEQLKKADVAVIYQHGDWNERRASDTDAFLARGGGLVYIHWAVDGGQHGDEFAKRIGLAKHTAIAFRHGPLDLVFNRDASHPISRNFDRLKLVDESYWKLAGPLPKERTLATSNEDGEPQPQLWTYEPSKGRVFVCIPGHYSWSFDDPLFRVLVLRGIAWVAREPVDRFNDVLWMGADR